MGDNGNETTAVTSLDDVIAAVAATDSDQNDTEQPELKREQTKAKPKVSVFQLYRFAGPKDLLMMLIASIFSIVMGVSIQVPYVAVMQLVNVVAGLKNCTDYTGNKSDCDVENTLDREANRITFAIGVTGIACCFSAYFCTSLFTVVADRVTRRVRQLAFTNILRQHIGYFDIHFAGELNTRLTQDVMKFEIGIGSKIALIIFWLSTFVTALTICMVYGWQLTLFMCILLPVAGIVGGITTKLMKKYSEREMTAYAKAGSVAEEALTNIRVVHAYAGQRKEANRYEKLLGEAWKVSLKSGLAASFGVGVPYFSTLAVTAATVYLSGILLRDGKIDPGFVIMLLNSMFIGLRSIGFAAVAMEVVSDSQAAAFGLYEIIDAKTQIDSTDESGKKLDVIKGFVQFKDIHFVYPARPGVTVLRGLNLDIPPGKSAALVGPSGCGKSTTIQLLQRFYDPLQGAVYVDGHDVKELNLKWLRQQIGVVSQDPVLFATTIEDNIRFGNPLATKEDIETAAKEADAHHFIMKLPQKYETLMNEQGTQLSRGEKQRISLARALVRKPKILLLDECTSALDNESEATVQKALDKAAKGRTTIIIAHRLSTVKDADTLFVIDKGVVAESGSHAGLLEKRGIYHKLVSLQLMEEKEKAVNEELMENDDEILLKVDPQYRKLSVVSAISAKSNRSNRSNKTTNSHSNYDPEDTDDDDEDQALPSHALRRVFALNKEKWPYLLFGLIGGILVGTTWPLYAMLISYVTKGSVGDLESINTAALGILILAVSSCIVCVISTYLLRYFGETLALKLRSMSYAAMLKQEISWFDKPSNQVGSLTSRLAEETAKVKMATGTALLSFATAVSGVACTIVISLTFGWQLGLAVLPVMPLTVVAGAAQGYFNSTYEYKSHKRTESSGRVASEAIDKVRTLASLTKESFFIDKYMSSFEALKKEAYKRANVIGLSWSFLYFCQFALGLIVFGFGVWLSSKELMEFHYILGILTVVLTTCADVGRANSNVPELTASATSAAKLLQLLKRKPQINTESDEGIKPKTCAGEVELRDVCFAYQSRSKTLVLRSVQVAASRGQSVAIVGPSGGGKSTVVQLMERFYDVLTGVVTVDGVDIRELNVSWLRSQMAVVLQEPILFAVSIADNIAYGDNSRQLSMNEIIDAAKAANIHSFITTLPDGYDTNVGSKGTQLSGGQKQRISIARALVRNPKILLLDDATSALDSHSESVVEEALNKARAGRTSIIIAHRLSSIINADVILYVDRGKVLERGTHSQLMALKNHYYGLYQANLGNKST